MIVFKLERERPAYDIYNGRMFYVKDKYLRMHEFGSQRDVPAEAPSLAAAATPER